MADAVPASFSKTMNIRDAESVVTTNATGTRYGVLTTDNTAAYTPTEDYHPATKVYVDEGSISSDGSITDLVKLTAAEYGALAFPDSTTLYVIEG